MDKHESKIILKRKNKPTEVLFDSDDDEPIGTFLKLKSKKNSKRIKVVEDVNVNKVEWVGRIAVEDKDLCMDDTLANFRKKLKGPKKESGSAVEEGKYFSNEVDPLKESLTVSSTAIELDPSIYSVVKGKGPQSSEGEYSEEGTLVEGLQAEAKMDKKRSNVNSDTIKLHVGEPEFGNSFDHQRSENDEKQHEEKVFSEYGDEALREKQERETQFQKSPSHLRPCSNQTTEVQDCDSEAPKDQYLASELNVTALTVNPVETLPDGILDLSKSSFETEISDKSLCAPVSSHKEENKVPEQYGSSPIAACDNLNYELDVNHDNESQRVLNEPEGVLESSHVLHEDACPCPPNCDYRSGDEEVNGTSNSSLMVDQGSSPEQRGSPDDREINESSLSVLQRTVRNAKKPRHGDMAYEGDADWEVLMQGQEFFISHQEEDKTREKFNSLSLALDAENGKAAAVSAGLKARAVGPIEKIKFKEVLKRKGGLQEYLEHRNHILSAWNKDTRRILPLSDFGVSETYFLGESQRASLIRDIYFFLDQCGYINFGVPSEKGKVINWVKHDPDLLMESLGEDNVLPLIDSECGVTLSLGEEKSSETLNQGENSDIYSDGKPAGKFQTRDGIIHGEQLINSIDPLPGKEALDSKKWGSVSPTDGEKDKNSAEVFPDLRPAVEVSSSLHSADTGPKKNIIVIGAGPAGLTAARHLQRQGFSVAVLEARSRTGGRVFTDCSSLSVPVDLGASIITGVEADVDTERRADPSSLICSQLGIELTVLNSDCPLYDTVTAQKVSPDLDEALEAEYNSLLDEMVPLVAEKGELAMTMSLEEGLEYALKKHRFSCNRQADDMAVSLVESLQTARSTEVESLSPLDRRVMDWHFAHLEYGCAALLKDVSLPNWNQDDVYGGFGGAHCMIKGGYSAVTESLAEGLCIHLDHIVTDVAYCVEDCGTSDRLQNKVKVSTLNGRVFSGDAVLVTVPLGCLKAETIKFSPPLPQWKHSSIKRLGFGVLNKVVLEFPEVFWDDSIDYFGATAEDTDQRGRCFMFWNVRKTVGAPVLIALVVGKAAIDDRYTSTSEHVTHALLVLRKLYGEEQVPDPVASVVTDWGKDPYSFGAYSYVAVGSSGDDYDILGRPVENCIFFAGEATCKEHPDTVGGAIMSGLREAVRIIDILNTGKDYAAEVEAMEAARRHSHIEKSEVKDLIRRLDAIEFSSVLSKDSLDGSRISNWRSMLKDMFFTAKTTAGRLHLAKELLNLPVGFLKTFASTREGLSTLNSWILDSMGKNGTQLLRHCVRLLVLVSNDLLAVRLSGVGKTVKEKVCVHTSRDIRAIASQLVNVWVELFRKEKAVKGRLRPSSVVSKIKPSLVHGRPPLRTHHMVSEGKEASKVAASGEHRYPYSGSTKKIAKMQTRIYQKSDAQLSNSHDVIMEDYHESPMSEEEKAALAAAEAAHAAAAAAAEAYASFGTLRKPSPQLPKILSFQRFATREQFPNMDDPDCRKKWSGAAIGRQDCLTEIDSRNCRVRDWSVDFSAAGVNLENSKISVDNDSQRSHHSNEVVASQMDFREPSGESLAVDSSILTKAWVDSAGSMGLKDYNAIERWQCQAAAANSSGFSHHATDEEDSNMSSEFHKRKSHDMIHASSQPTLNKDSQENQLRGADRIKHSVVDYVASLLMPLYKARKIDKESYKSIMKKTATKVMESTSDAEKAMAVSEFLDYKRKNKIRAFVDTLIERTMTKKADVKTGTSGK